MCKRFTFNNKSLRSFLQIKIFFMSSNREMLEEFSRSVWSNVKCTNCSTFFKRGSIFMCTIGHSVCNQCKSNPCSICKSYCGPVRNFHLEGIARHLAYPCENEGCEVLEILDETENHLLECHYGMQTCPMNLIDEDICDWEGLLDKVKHHFLFLHPAYLWDQEIVDCFRLDATPHVQIIQKFENAFCVQHCLENEFYYWAVQYIGDSNLAENYSFELCIRNDADLKVQMKRKCAPYPTSCYECIEKNWCLGFPRKFILQDTFNNIFYKLTIVQNY